MIYEDNRGWHFMVLPGLGDSTYKARYNKPMSNRWTGVRVLPWRSTQEEAEKDLAEYAEKHDMKVVTEGGAENV